MCDSIRQRVQHFISFVELLCERRDIGFNFCFAKKSYSRPWIFVKFRVEMLWKGERCLEMSTNTRTMCCRCYSAVDKTKKNCGACRSLGWLAGHRDDGHSHGYGRAIGRRKTFRDNQAAKSSLWKWARSRRWPRYSLLLHNLFLPNNSRFVNWMSTKPPQWSTTNGKVQMNTVE